MSSNNKNWKLYVVVCYATHVCQVDSVMIYEENFIKYLNLDTKYLKSENKYLISGIIPEHNHP